MRPAVKRLAVAAGLLAVLCAPVSTAAPPKSWAAAQIKLVTAQGAFESTPDAFRPDDPLTAGDLAHAVATVTGAEEQAPANADAPVTLAGLDAAFVRGLGLADAGYRFRTGAVRAGLKPPARFGPEVVARLLGLRLNHPAARDELELQPQEPATRAEAAYSAAQVLHFEGGEADAVKEAAQAFELPALTPWQRRILQTAVSFIGYPYVWGGEDERAERGFDCSGFIWRVYKLAQYAGGEALPATLTGRTTYQLSGEVPKAERIGIDELEPGDVLFFGKGPKSRPKDVDHAAIYLGNGWFIHSSGYGVALAPLEGWYRDGFAWARRPLAEAGLD
jgi:cell wall-associated NlpC family hydrolase